MHTRVSERCAKESEARLGDRARLSRRAERISSYNPCLLLAAVEAIGNLGTLGRNNRFRRPDAGPVQGWNLLGLRFLRRFRLDRAVEGGRLANERLEGGLVNLFSFVDVDRAAYVPVETRVKETGRILQGRALGEGKFHDL